MAVRREAWYGCPRNRGGGRKNGMTDEHQSYRHLQQRLDRMPIGAPTHRALFDILHELYSPEEAALAASMPMRPAGARTIARRAGVSETRAKELLEGMLPKGLVVDMARPDGRTAWFLNPAVIGFFEFTMMRVRDDIDQKRIATLMWAYLREDPEHAFVRMLGEGPTFIARPAVHEDALSAESSSDILDWERASQLVETAPSWAEGICHCRHVKKQIGQGCEHPLDNCLSFGMGADYLVRAGIAKRIDKVRAREVLEDSRRRNSVQRVDNVRRRPTFICNCCSCCCEMLEGMRVLGAARHPVTSNFVASVSDAACNGCGKCVKKCPIGAIELRPAERLPGGPKRKAAAHVDERSCLGCGVCHRQCKFDALSMRRIPTRMHTPESQMERMLLQAIERGKLPGILFDDPSQLSHRILGGVLGTILDLPPAKQLLARQQVRSRFVEMLVSGWKRSSAGWTAKL